MEWAKEYAWVLALGLLWPVFKSRVLPAVKDWLVGKGVAMLLSGLRGDGIDDADLKEFEHRVVLAFIHLAEKKLPDSGLGPERKQWVAAQITRVFPWLHGHEAELSEIIEQAVIKMDQELKKLDGGA